MRVTMMPMNGNGCCACDVLPTSVSQGTCQQSLGIVAMAAAVWHYRIAPALTFRPIRRRSRRYGADLQRIEPQRMSEPNPDGPLLL
jgi:hypothetical protein